MESLGSYLKRERELREVSMAEVAQTTRIPSRIITQLENDELEVLPADIFIRGYLRAYARAVALDEGEVLSRHQRKPEPDVPPPLPAVYAAEPGRRFGIALALVILLILFTLALSIVLRAAPPRRADRVESADGGDVRAQVECDDALLLRSVDFGESDRVLTLLTRGQGKLGVLAKGARRSKRRFAGALEPFSVLRVEIAAGRSGLARLETATIAQPFPKLLGDLARMTLAGAMLGLVRELVPDGVPDSDGFDDAVALLAALDAALLAPRALAVCFQLSQLARAGFSPRLSACGSCGKRPEGGRATDFDARRGYIVCQACGGAAYRLRAAARDAWLLSTEGDFRVAAAREWTAENLDTARSALESFVAHRLERESPSSSMKR